MKLLTNRLVFALTTCLIELIACTKLFAYEQADIDKAYAYIGSKWVYYDMTGNKISVTTLGRKATGADNEIIINGVSMNPATLFDSEGKNLANPEIKNSAIIINVTGLEPGVLKGITQAHNNFRKQTGGGEPDLVWSAEIATYAHQWAEYLQKNNNCKMMHRSQAGKQDKNYGENIAWVSGRDFSAGDPVQMWYDEIKYYDYAKNACEGGVCGHYTQVVWKDSQRVGCGMVNCGNDELWVCNYDPAGNVVGQKPY